MLHVFGIYGRLLSNILVVKEICSVMDSKYPTAWRPLLRDVVKIRQERDETKPAAKLRSFLLFVRLPTWRTQGNPFFALIESLILKYKSLCVVDCRRKIRHTKKDPII